MKEKKYPFGLYTEASINMAKDDELMGLMRDAGFDMVFVGIESPDTNVLLEMDVKDCFANCHSIDPIHALLGGFIAGILVTYLISK